MDKEVERWSVCDLRANLSQIDFPEYQREPNLWSLVEKQRLIDSMVRRFDIASLYFYRHDKDSIDCVDGRQRIGAILSFLGVERVGGDRTNEHASFQFRHLNEVYEDDSDFESLEGMSFQQIQKRGQEEQDGVAQRFLTQFLEYPLTVVMLSESERPEEFNLQFTRLNLGTIINSGEKLHAMVGELRDECFERLGQHSFLEQTDIPTRRFAREQVAAQILAQVFSQSESERFTRTRHFDLQSLFKRNSRLSESQREIVNRVSGLFDLLEVPFKKMGVLRNRAITVSTVLLAWNKRIETDEESTDIAGFVEEFVHRLNWQRSKGLNADREYYYLLEFHRSISQASAESYSVDARANVLEEEFERWRDSKVLRGDSDWTMQNQGRNPSDESRR